MISAEATPQQPPIGIDLGTTNSLIAYWDGEKSVLIPNSLDELLTPSVISLSDGGKVLVGSAARERRITHPQLTASLFKRVMGSSKNFRLDGRDFKPEELSSLVLQSLKHDAEVFLKCTVSDVIVSVPAYFNDTQRKATKAAAELAGLKVLRLINEPTAASLAYGLNVAQEETRFLVFDLGGGTFDVSIVELFDGVVEVKASTGDNYLGGEDFTSIIEKEFAEQLAIGQEELERDAILRNRLQAVAERCKVDLSEAKSVRFPFLHNDKSVDVELTEDRFESLAASLLDRLRKPIERAMRDSRLKPEQLSAVVMVGGASRMPIVRKIVTRMFGRFPDTSVHADHAIALGAATQAALVARDAALEEVLMTDVCPYSLGVAVSQQISQNQTMNGLFSPIIERNTVVPTSRVGSYSTMADGQKVIDLNIYQGEQRFVNDNVFLGKLQVPVPAARRGEISVDVRFTYDVSGLLDVDATVTKTGKKHSLTLLGNAATLTETEIAERRKELLSLKIHPRDDMPNQLLLSKIERSFAELSGSDREAVGQALANFTATLSSQDADQIARERKQLTDWLGQLEASPFN